MCSAGSGNTVTWINGWSALSRIMPILGADEPVQLREFHPLERRPDKLDRDRPEREFSDLPERGQIAGFDARLRLAGVTNYGVNQGDWFVWGGFNGSQNRNAFGMNRSRRIAEFIDGTSQTFGRRGQDLPAGLELPDHSASFGQ